MQPTVSASHRLTPELHSRFGHSSSTFFSPQQRRPAEHVAIPPAVV